MNTLSFAVLRALAKGGFHSGAALAQSLGVSRGTIWNSVREIDRAGLTVYRVRGRGYRIAAPVAMLDRESIVRHMGPLAARFHVEVDDVVDSTNTQLMQRAAAGAASGTVMVSELQRGGRGRMGRAWHSGLGEALTFSLLWRFDRGAGALAGLSLAVGVAVVRALARLGARDMKLKWPNDVLANGRKLAGILIEMHGDALGPSSVVIGIGLNVSLSSAVRAKIEQPVADLASVCGSTPDRNEVLGILLVELARVLDVFAERGFKPLKAEWMRSHAYQDENVAFTIGANRTEHGIVRGVADDGALLVETAGTIGRIHSGEVQVRRIGDASRRTGEKRLRRPV